MVDLAMVKRLFARTCGRVRYKLGAKAPSLSASSSDIHAIDCSGWVRWVLHRSGITLPDGSQQQWAHVRDVLGWRKVPYSNMRYAENDPKRLFIAFKRATKSKHGHVWLICCGYTMESYGGNGVGARWWSSVSLVRAVEACYEVPVV